MNMAEVQIEDTGRWDHDKAAAMAHQLITRTEFLDLLESQVEKLKRTEAKRFGILEKSTQRSIELAEAETTDARTLLLRQRAVAARAVMEEAEIEIELIELRDRQIAEATQVSDELLEYYSRFYDTNPERFAAMDGEQFGDLIQKIDDYKAFSRASNKGLSYLRDTMSRTSLYDEWLKDGKRPHVDYAVVDVTRDCFKDSLQHMFGKDSEEVKQLIEEYQALNDNAYETLSPRALVLAYCELNRKWHQFIVDAKAAKEEELEALLSDQDLGSTNERLKL